MSGEEKGPVVMGMDFLPLCGFPPPCQTPYLAISRSIILSVL